MLGVPKCSNYFNTFATAKSNRYFRICLKVSIISTFVSLKAGIHIHNERKCGFYLLALFSCLFSQNLDLPTLISLFNFYFSQLNSKQLLVRYFILCYVKTNTDSFMNSWWGLSSFSKFWYIFLIEISCWCYLVEAVSYFVCCYSHCYCSMASIWAIRIVISDNLFGHFAYINCDTVHSGKRCCYAE